MRERLTTLGELAGAALVTVGAWDLARPLGLIVGGLTLIGVSYLEARS